MTQSGSIGAIAGAGAGVYLASKKKGNKKDKTMRYVGYGVVGLIAGSIAGNLVGQAAGLNDCPLQNQALIDGRM